jgi:hypothetical protein
MPIFPRNRSNRLQFQVLGRAVLLRRPNISRPNRLGNFPTCDASKRVPLPGAARQRRPGTGRLKTQYNAQITPAALAVGRTVNAIEPP